MCHFLLQLFNRPVEAGLKTLYITISEGQEKCRASGAYIDGFINLADEIYYYRAEIPKFSPQNNHKTVRTVDKTRIEYLNCREKVKNTFSWFYIRI
jgi:hypothetical protein